VSSPCGGFYVGQATRWLSGSWVLMAMASPCLAKSFGSLCGNPEAGDGMRVPVSVIGSNNYRDDPHVVG
jgi:hypothetical protein